MEVRRLSATDAGLVAAIDRSEHVDMEYRLVDGHLEQLPAEIPDIAAWDEHGSGPHSVAAHVEFCRSVLARGAEFLGVFDAAQPAGLAIVDPVFEPGLAWLASLHVSRPYRRRGVAQALWDAALEISVAAGAQSVYVSATPTESAIGFYLRQGFRPAERVHPDLFAKEPDDIHLVRALS